MNCDAFMATLNEYYHGHPSAETKAQVEAHAERCASCGSLKRVADEIGCEEFVEFLDEYVDGTLAGDRKAVFERHMAICRDCLEYLRGYRASVDLAKDAYRLHPLPHQPVPEDLVRAILAARRTDQRSG